MYPFELFYNNWLDINPVFDPIEIINEKADIRFPVHLPDDFFIKLDLSREKLKQYRIQAAIEAKRVLGDNPALCFSGGVDSQAMLQCFMEAGIKVDVYTLTFKNDLNIQDVSTAREYCKKYDIELKEIEIDIKKFLQRENYDYGIKYESASPHFNTHYKLFDFCKNLGHTGICAGGDVATVAGTKWGENFKRNPLNFVNYSRIAEIPVIGSFLSFYPNLSWAISILTKPFVQPPYDLVAINLIESVQQQYRYHDKINGYIRSGFKLIAQPKKFTGFELVKIDYEYITKDPMEFEKRFRKPLEDVIRPVLAGCSFDLNETQLKELYEKQSKNFSTTVFFGNFINIYNSFQQNPFNVDDTRAWL